MKKITVTLGAVSALLVACAANTSAPPTGESSEAETVGQVKQEDLSCVAFLPSAATLSYVNVLAPYCQGEFTANVASLYGSTTYGTSACPYFVAEFDGTTINPTGAFNAVVDAGNITDDIACGNATLNVQVYGFEDSFNPAVYGIPGWIEIASVTGHGNWNGTSCIFSTASGISSAVVPFTDAIPNAPPTVIPRYLNFRVAAQVAVSRPNKGGPTTSYSPLATIQIMGNGCT